MKINFAHNVYDRPNRLKETIRIEKELFPNAGIFIAYNNRAIENEIKSISGASSIYFAQSTHKIGCVNGAYFSISLALQDNPDVIIFSHDDVYISNPEKVKGNINMILNEKFDFVGRIPCNLPDIGKKYIMMEAMFLSPIAARCIYRDFKPFVNEQDIERDLRGSISPEVNMYNIVTKSILHEKICGYTYIHENDPYRYNKSLNDILGYTHENIGIRGWVE